MTPFTTRPVIACTNGVVAAGHYLAASISMRILSEGGNAMDAGVAGAFALSLLKPHQYGIGGEAPILLYRSGEGFGSHLAAINGQGTAPRRATIEWFSNEGIGLIPGDGFLPATVPAAFGALLMVLLRYGRFDLDQILEPAIRLAREGFAVYPQLREALEKNAERFREEWPSTVEVFLDNGKVPGVGWLLKQPDWAKTFQSIVDVSMRERPRGREAMLQAALDYFYRGPVAQKAVSFASSNVCLDASGKLHRGLLGMDDFANFETKIERPVTVRYRGLDVFKCGPWTQGPVFLQQLRLLEGFDLSSLGHNSVQYIHTLVEAAKLAFADRETYYGDPDFAYVPLERLLSQEYADARRGLIDASTASSDLPPGDGPPLAADSERELAPDYSAGDTTHIDVIDRDGNMFAATPSGGWVTSSPLIPGLGFALGTRGQQFNLEAGHPNALAPMKRPRSTLTPSLAMKDGHPYMVFGTPGGDRQDQWTLQFFLNHVCFGMNLQEAIDAPTFHTEHFPSSFFPHEAFPRRVVVEGRLSRRVCDELRSKGHDILVSGEWEHGEVSAVRFDARTGLIEGAASPRGMTAYTMGY